MILLIVLSLLHLDVLSAHALFTQRPAVSSAESFSSVPIFASIENHTSPAVTPSSSTTPSSTTTSFAISASSAPIASAKNHTSTAPPTSIGNSPIPGNFPILKSLTSPAIPITSTSVAIFASSAASSSITSRASSGVIFAFNSHSTSLPISTSKAATTSKASPASPATISYTTSTISASIEKTEKQFFGATVESRLAVGGPTNDAAEEQEDPYEGIPASEIEKVVSEELQIAKKTHFVIDDIAGSFLFMSPEREYFTEVMSVSIAHPTGEKRITIPLKILDQLSDDEQEHSIKFYEKDKSKEKMFKGRVKMKLFNGEYISLNGEVKKNRGKEKRKLDVTLHPVLAALGNSTITVSNKQFHLNGTLGTISYRQLKDLIAKHPDIKTLVLHESDGSVNDAVNMHTGRLVRKNKITTMVLKDSQIHSGAVDLFASGEKRIFNRGAELGVHSWCCVEDKTAVQLPDDHPGHKAQLQYFTEMLGKVDGPAFYFFTIKAAAFDDVKIMTEREIKKYNLATEIK